MSYRIRLFVTHIATAIVAGYCVWYGLQVRGFSQLAFMVLFGASIVVPNAVAAWWLMRGLRQMELSLTDVPATVDSTGLPELDKLMRRLQTTFERQRTLVQNVDELVQRLGHNTSHFRGRLSAADDQLLTDALGHLSRASARNVGCIMTFADDIANGAHDAHWGTQEQDRTVADAISSVELLSGRIDAISNDAAAAQVAVTDVVERAAAGLELIEHLVRGMEDIRTNAEYSEQRVSALGQQSVRISTIVETMGNISARTDMLALNASIEAVRAGQEGRGFAIVAEEVRKLADSTATASRDIASLADAIQRDAHETVAAITEERRQVQEEIQRVSEAGITLEAISCSAARAAARSHQISEVTGQQLQHTQELVRAMQQLSAIAGRIGERSESIRHKTTDLVEAAQDLEEGLSPMYHYGDSDNMSSEHQTAAEVLNNSDRRGRHPQQTGDELLEAVVGGEFAS